MWRFIAPAFEKEYRVILFDNVGAGDSDGSAYDQKKYSTLNQYADDVLAICRELDLTKPIFVGHSVSATIGILAAIKEPALFDSLVLIGPSPCYFDDGNYHGGFNREALESLLAQADNDYLGWARSLAPAIMGNPDQPELGKDLTNSFCRTNPTIAAHFARVLFLSDHRADLPKVKTPSLILQCAHDIVAPEFVGRYVHKHLPQSEFVVLQAIGHCPHVSAPEETESAIKNYLEKRR